MKQIPSSSQIIAFGDNEFYLSYEIDKNKWVKYDRDDNLPLLKYPGICSMDTNGFLLTGGCFVLNNEASNNCYQITVTSKFNFNRWWNMNHKRYGHCSIYANGYVYVIGGFE